MLNILLSLLFFLPLLAEEKISTHSIQIDREPLFYTATVESGEVSYIAYVKEGENRPITFAFNGGPGSSSVWLHMGALGPKRIVTYEEGQSIAPPYQIVDNPETILDLTDLVLIDPMGTGLSSMSTKEDAKKHYSITGDIASVGKFIRDYLTKNKRWNSAKYLAGESYGGLRVAGLADILQNEFGIYLNGVIFISAAIDFQTFFFDPDNALPYFLFLPSYATTAWYYNRHHRPELTVEEIAQAARDFVYKTYAPFLIGPKGFDPEPIYEEVAKITGLSPDLVRRSRGRISDEIFLTNFLGDERKIVGRFDSRISGYSTSLLFQDPSDALINGIFAGSFHDYLHRELGFVSSYSLASYEIFNQWNYWDYNRWGYPNLMSGLRKALIANPHMKIFVACGYFDLATPFAVSEYCFDHLDVPNISVQMEYYEGGHMFYLTPSARIKFKQDLIRFYQRTP